MDNYYNGLFKEGERVEVSLYDGHYKRYGPHKVFGTIITIKKYPPRFRVMLDSNAPGTGERDIYIREEQLRQLTELEAITDSIHKAGLPNE
jgi:hypothetical protein